MKLRIRGDTLRLRLTRSEVDAIGRGEPVVEQTNFPDGSKFTYSLGVGGDAVAASHTTEAGGAAIEIKIPSGRAEAWAASDEVGLNGEASIAVGPLAVLIEKDFSCITPRGGEQELDTFPNPNAPKSSANAGA